MSCNHCNTKFNFFHKEMGCNNCGLSFCSKCLKQKCIVPDKGSSELHVCRVCYSKLTSGTSTNTSKTVVPPDAFLKRLENLENPAVPPITVYKQVSKMQNLKTGLTSADQKLVDRLEKLKDDRKKPLPPTETELRTRLANLKGENTYSADPGKFIFEQDTRSDQQKTDSLLEQFVSERDIELSHNPQEEIEARLASLREQGIRPNEGQFLSNLHDSSSSEEGVDKITKKIMDEVALEAKYLAGKVKPESSSNSPPNNEEFDVPSPDELPWCVLCNNDANFRCLDCSCDLYCAGCMVEVHKTWGESNHKAIPFSKK